MSFAISSCSQAQVADTYSERAKTIAVRANMVEVQKAAEKYFKDHTYMYPTTIDADFKSYFEGGDPASKKAGKPPINPFTGNPEFPVLGTITDLAQARLATPFDVPKGVIQYSPLENGKSYGIVGGADTGKAIHSEDAAQMGTLVLSRDDYQKPAN
jgi:hypothetical protein